MRSTAAKLPEISISLQIHNKLDKQELLTVISSLIEMAERLERLEGVCPGHPD